MANVSKGVLFPLGNGFSLAIGKHPNKVDDIDIGPNNKNGLSVNHGEILQNTGRNIRVFSAEPILRGASPSQLVYGGANPNAVFAAQEAYKKANRLRDDGSHYKKGGKKKTPVKESIPSNAERDSAQVNIFKPGANDRIQSNRIAHRKSLEDFVNKYPTLYGLNTADFVDFLLDNSTMESENSPTAKHGSMYGYYQLKGLSSKSNEEQQHRAAFKHLRNLFDNVLTDADIEEAKKQGISQAQLLHKTWNQERKVLNYLYQGKDSSDGLGTKISEWGNNNLLEMNYLPYVMKATNDANITIKKGDTPEGLLKSYRGADLKERTFNDHAIDFENTFGISSNNLRIGQTITNNYLIGPRKQDGTFKLGGQTNKQSLGERPNAKFGKEMGTKKKLLYPNADVVYKLPNGDLTSIKAGKLEGKQMPQGTIIVQNTNGMPGTPNGTPISRTPNTAYRGYQRTIKYGETPEQNDTTYTVRNINGPGLGIKDAKEGFNQDFYAKKFGGNVRKKAYAGTQFNFSYPGFSFDKSKESLFIDDLGDYNPALGTRIGNINYVYSSPIKKFTPTYLDGPLKGQPILGTTKLGTPIGPITNPELYNFAGRKATRINDFDLRTGTTVNNNPVTIEGLSKAGLPTTTSSVSNVKTPSKFGQFMNSQAGADLIGAGINAAGTIASAIINNKYADKLQFTPKEAVHYNPVKLKTKINIAPQIAQMKEMRAKLQDAAVKTSASSRTAYQKILAGHNSLLESAMNLYGQKENQETQLINQDRLNQQSVAHKNAKEFIDTVNYNAAGRDNLENTRAQLKAQNAVSTINNLAGIVNGPQGLLARKEARNSQLANLAVMSAAYPDAIKLMQGDNWEKRLNGLRNLVNNGYWG